MRRKGLRRGIMTMLASVLIMASGAGALAATGDLIRSGTTGACKYEVTETGSYRYSCVISGNGDMED